MAQDMRRTIPLLIAFIFGTWLFLDYFLNISIINVPASTVKSWVGVMAAGSMSVGGVSVVLRYARSIGKEEGTWYPLVVLGSMAIMIIAGLPWFDAQYDWMVETIRDPIELASYGMVLFFITSAAFRAFRMRSLDTVFMVIAAFFAFLADSPMSGAVFPIIMNSPGKLIQKTIVVAVNRAVLFSSYMGLFLLWLRTTLGLERRGLGVES